MKSKPTEADLILAILSSVGVSIAGVKVKGQGAGYGAVDVGKGLVIDGTRAELRYKYWGWE
jgi:hypothetical protein